MSDDSRLITAASLRGDDVFDRAMRPLKLTDYVAQSLREWLDSPHSVHFRHEPLPGT